MVPQLGAPLGLMVASALFAYFLSNLSDRDFLDWGWRYPFFVAFAINVVALFARLRIVVTPEYAQRFETHDLEPAAIRETVRVTGRNIVIGAFAPLASFALFHIVTVFPLSWVFLFTQQEPAHFLVIQTVCAAVGVTAIVASGLIADRTGRRTVLAITAGMIAAFSGFAPQLLNAGEVGQWAFMLTGFALLGLSFGQSSGAVASSFPQQYRYTASALTSDLAWLFGAGFAPLVALALSARFGLVFAGAYLLSGAVCTVVALLINRQLVAQER
jgi:MFS family permease